MFSYWNVAGYDPGDPIILNKGEDKELLHFLSVKIAF